MSGFKTLFCAVSGLLLSFSILISPARAQAENNVINAFVRSQAARTNADEYAEARRLIWADLNGDGIKDGVLLYTLEGQDGSNNYLQYLSVFTGSRGGRVKHAAGMLVGGKNKRSVSEISFRQNLIRLDAMSYRPADPSCCPSRKEIVKIRFAGNKLKQVR